MAGNDDALRNLVLEAGRRLKRPEAELEPHVQTLLDNWFDRPELLVDAKPEELTHLGIPMRFAKELIIVATSGPGQTLPPPPARRIEVAAPPKARAEEPHAEFIKSLAVRDCEAAFKLKPAILGNNGENIRHIEAETGAKVRMMGGQNGPLELEICASSRKSRDEAAQLAEELLQSVYDMFSRKDSDKKREDTYSKDQYKDRGDGWKRHDDRQDGYSKQRQSWDDNYGYYKQQYNDRDNRQGNDHGREKGGSKGVNKSREGGSLQDVVECGEFQDVFRVKGRLIGIKGANLHHIQDETNTRVDLRGEGGPKDPIRFEISGDDRKSVGHAVTLCRELLATVKEQYEEWISTQGGEVESKSKGKGKGEARAAEGRTTTGRIEKQFKDVIEVFETDPQYRAKGRLIGPKGRNIFHIQDDTGAKVFLAGDGDAGEPMRFEVSADTSEQLDRAMNVTADLLESVRAEYEAWVADGKGKNQSNGRTGEYKDVVDVFECYPEFRAKGKLIGKKGQHLHHIQNESGARLRLEGDGDAGEPMRFEIHAETPQALEHAVRMANDLMESVRVTYEEWLSNADAEGSGKGKGKKGGKRSEAFVEYVDVHAGGDSGDCFSLRARIVGNKGANLFHIQDQTGAVLQLQGDGDAGEAMRMKVSADNSESVEEAVSLVRDLVASVEASASAQKYTEALDVFKREEFGEAFSLRSKILGTKGRNLFHIQDKTGASLKVDGDGDVGEDMRIKISAESEEDLASAVKMARDLLDAVHQQYEEWLEEVGSGQRSSRGKSKWPEGGAPPPPPPKRRAT